MASEVHAQVGGSDAHGYEGVAFAAHVARTANYTPGPLTVSIEDGWPFKIVTSDAAGNIVFVRDMPSCSTRHKSASEAVAGVGLDPKWNAAEQNGRAVADEVLRAAAGDLLEALEQVTAVLDAVLMVDLTGIPAGADGPAVVARAAMAKARGLAS